MPEQLSVKNGNYVYLPDYNVLLNSEIRDLFLKKGAGRKITIVDPAITPAAIAAKVRNLSQIIFEVTQNCNLQCKYCIFGGSYFFERRNSPENMEWETAKKGLDFFHDMLQERQKRELTIGLYGGEPLLRFDLIKKIAARAHKLFSGWKLMFFITSNMTVLNREMIRFLIEEQVHLNVSLDGPREIHDAKRVFPDGSGSFDLVMKNLTAIKKADEEYFKTISISAVFSSDLSWRKIFDFFTTDKLVKEAKIIVAGVNRAPSDYFDRYPIDKERVHRERAEVMQLVCAKIKRGEKLTPIEGYTLFEYQKLESFLNARHFNTLAGTCVFDERVYINVKGQFHVCERINDKFSFGNADSGIDYEKAGRMVEKFKAFNKTKCLPCPIRFSCERCFATAARDGTFEMDPANCRNQINGQAQFLENYIRLQEKGALGHES